MQETFEPFPNSLKPGVFVFVCAIDKEPGKTSHYNDGEYLVVSVGAARKSFSAIKTKHPGYDAGSVTVFSCHDVDAADIYEDDYALALLIDNMRDFAEVPDRGEKLQWQEHVYRQAGATAQTLGRILAQRTGQPNARVLPASKMEQFEQILKGPTWDGNLIGKSIRDSLVLAGLVARESGWNFPTAAGIKLGVAVGLLKT